MHLSLRKFAVSTAWTSIPLHFIFVPLSFNFYLPSIPQGSLFFGLKKPPTMGGATIGAWVFCPHINILFTTRLVICARVRGDPGLEGVHVYPLTLAWLVQESGREGGAALMLFSRGGGTIAAQYNFLFLLSM